MDSSSVELHNKLCRVDSDLASPPANLEAFWDGWWPLSELLEIRALSRAAVCSGVTGLAVAPGFSVNVGAVNVLLSHVIPPSFPSSLLQSCLPFSGLNSHRFVRSQTQQLWLSSAPNTDWARHRGQCEPTMFSAFKEVTVQWGRRANTQLYPVCWEAHQGQGSSS